MKRNAKGLLDLKVTPLAGGAKNISIVLVEPRGAGNIGSTARAMKNNGLGDLVLVNPCDYINDECLSMACNATSVIRDARVFPDLKAALSGFSFVVGTTRRLGKARHPVFALHEAIPTVVDMCRKNKTAILFGREDRGLENPELELCNILVELPAHDDYPSLNLSHAVFLFAHYFYKAGRQGPEAAGDMTIEAAPSEEVEKMYVHMEEMLRALEYGDKGGGYLLRLIVRNCRKLFGRTALMQREVNMLRGVFSQITCRVDTARAEDKIRKEDKTDDTREETGS
ncbi:MAG: RNA methyltransferase [Thermodesulfobacteriota bacterium]|nr:MAG: RNA methyltransferase [Thermodesulfobacteriota bacterium]